MSEKKQGRIVVFAILLAIFVIGLGYWANLYWASFPNLKLESYSDLGQFITAVIAVAAAGLAGWQVIVQRELARQRNAFDFFFKTEMEPELWETYRESRPFFRDLRLGMPVAPFIGSAGYHLVRRYLNLHELMSVGIHQDVLDDEVCYSYWGGELIEDFESARSLINYIRNDREFGSWYTYSDIERTYLRWRDRRAIANRERRPLRGPRQQ